MNLLCVIQARMDSFRFPGKVLADLAGYPILEHVVTRCRASGLQTVIATTARDVDDPILMWAATQSDPVSVFRWSGPEMDVLSRYVACAAAYSADAIIRVTGDSPLVPVEALEVVAEAIADDCEVSSLTSGFGMTPDGWEVEGCLVSCLRQLNTDRPTPQEREHVFPGVYTRMRQAGRYGNTAQPIPTKWTEPWLLAQRFSVDTPADLDWLRGLAEHLDFTPPRPTADDVYTLLSEHPELQRSPMKERA